VKTWCAILAAIAAGAVPGAVHAASADSTIAVSLTVEPGCSVAAGPLAFVAHAGEGATARSQVDVLCNQDTGVSVTLDDGRNAARGVRHLAGSDGGRVAYEIYSDAAHMRRWGAGADAVAAAVAGAVGLQLVAYGVIVAPDTAGAAGSYSDTVTVTVDF
jgi:spore coat protein U-like protein